MVSAPAAFRADIEVGVIEVDVIELGEGVLTCPLPPL
jgi:hypothetical protein